VEQHKVEIVSEPIKPPPTETLTFVERMPEFPGGQKALQDYLKGALRYPTAAREAEIQGTVYMGFVVETDGSISDVEVMRSVHPMLDAEAVRVISAMPHWIPGEQNQKKVRVRFALPINFRMHTP
jgi:TonB family protein